MGSLDTLPNTMVENFGNGFILVKALISSCWEFQSQFFAINLVQSIKVFGRYKYDKPKETLLVFKNIWCKRVSLNMLCKNGIFSIIVIGTLFTKLF